MAALPWSISKSGKFLLLNEVVTMTNVDIGMLSLEEDHEHKLLLHSDEYMNTHPTISPDGQWMAYCSNVGGTGNELYLRPFPDIDTGRVPVTSGGGATCPLWSPIGKELFYLSGDNSVMAVTVQTEPTFELGIPEKLFQSKYLSFGQFTGMVWDIHPDGDKFLMIKPLERTDNESAAPASPKINIVLNWFEELKKKVQVD